MWPGWDWVMEGYDEVSTDRQLGMAGAGPIPWSSVRSYAKEEGMLPDESRLFRRVVRRLDSVYLEMQSERSEKSGA